MKVVVAAAGTGGHINPGIAIANQIKLHHPEAEIVFIGTDRGLENDLVPRAGYALKTIEAYGLQKEISIRNFRNVMKTFHSKKDIEEYFQKFKPDLVIGTGGYVCVPVFEVATKQKIPTILHESNAYPGRAVKMFAKKVNRVLVGFEDSKQFLAGIGHVVVTGNPTKVKKKEITSEEKKSILEVIGVKTNLPIVLVFGGSQGAKRINEAMLNLIAEKKNAKYQIIWATGPKQYDEIKETLEQRDLNINRMENAKILPYIYNMEELMNIADLLVCRSGAMTITEIANVEKPAIFIPLPSRMANRQEDNARVLVKLNAARMILNEELTAERLAKEIDPIISDEEKRKKMGKNAGKISIAGVEEKIYTEIKKCLKS